MPQGIDKIVIAGAGPSGLLLALLLVQAGISVDILEKESHLDRRPRGIAYGPPAVDVFKRAGILEDARAEGLDVRHFAWKRLDGTDIARVDAKEFMGYDVRHLMLPVSELAPLIKRHLDGYKQARILWQHKVVSVGQDDSKAWADVETPEGQARFEAPYVIGCDGGTSGVRHSIFGHDFPGKTWDYQVIATNIRYPFDKFGYADTNWVVDPEHWAVIAAIDKTGLWRVAYGETTGLSEDEYRARTSMKLEQLIPGHPKPEDYEVVSWTPYHIHNRLAERMAIGRIALAGDAAHLCNPMGGLGLTGGISDVGSLADCLVGIHTGHASTAILDEYSGVRRQKFLEHTDKMSSSNLMRVVSDPDSLRNDPAVVAMHNAEKDPALKEKLLMDDWALAGDMKQFYGTAKA